MLTPGKVIPLYSPRYGLQPAIPIVCCCWPALSTKSCYGPMPLSSEATYG
jgi:hypothetical protein